MKRIRSIKIAALALTLFASGCIGTTSGGFSQRSGRSTVSGDANSEDPLSNGLDSTTSSDGAQAPCTNYIEGSSDRVLCMGCYSDLLRTKCQPSAKSFSECVDTSVKLNFVQLVNQCLANSQIAGFTCTRTCSSGQTLNNQCECVTPTVGGSGGTTSTGDLIDRGLTDYGPPIVTAYWFDDAIRPNSTGGGFPDSTFNPFVMQVRNRGDTVFRLNTYTVSNPECHISSPAVITPIASLLSPTPPAVSSDNVLADSIGVTNLGTGSPYTSYVMDFEDAAHSAGTWAYVPAADFVYDADAKISRVLRRAGSATGVSSAEVDLADTAGMTNDSIGYDISFDLYTIDSWDGTADGDVFGIKMNGSGSYYWSRRFSNQTGKTQDDFSGLPTGVSIVTLARQTCLQASDADCGALRPDSKYRVVMLDQHPSGGVFKVKFEANLNSGASDETWAVDNIRVIPRNMPNCTIQYRFRDSNANQSLYCLRADVITECTNKTSCIAKLRRGSQGGGLFWYSVPDASFDPVLEPTKNPCITFSN